MFFNKKLIYTTIIILTICFLNSIYGIEQFNKNTYSFSPKNNEQITDAYYTGIDNSATHMLIVWDTYDFEDSYDFFIYSSPEENVNDLIKYYTAPGYYRVSAVYALHLDIEDQLREGRKVWHSEYPEEN